MVPIVKIVRMPILVLNVHQPTSTVKEIAYKHAHQVPSQPMVIVMPVTLLVQHVQMQLPIHVHHVTLDSSNLMVINV